MSKYRSYYSLCKPNVVALLLLTAIVGMLLAIDPLAPFPIQDFILATLGILLASASAAAINQLLERHIDIKMKRTQGRPLPQGELSTTNALWFAVILGAIGEAVLYFFINPLTAMVTFLALIGYAVIYTLYLKPSTPQNIVIGGASGAAPPILGWCAMTGDITIEPLLLFLIIFVWTPPHFWALAIHRRDDYAKVNIPMLPITHGIKYTRWQILFYKLLLIAVSLLPVITGMFNWIYLISAVMLGVWYTLQAMYMLWQPDDKQLPMKSFIVSIWYLLLLFLAMLVDHYLLLFIQ